MAYSEKKAITARRLRQLHDRAKLTPLDELEIQAKREPPRKIAQRYGVNYRTIYWILFRDKWSELKKERLSEKSDID